MPLIRALSPNYPPIQALADARGATAIVVLGGGMETYRSRGAVLHAGSREHSLRALEAARVYRLLERPWVIVSGSLGPEKMTEAARWPRLLKLLGVPDDRLIEEGKSRNTHDHTLYVPPLLAEHGVKQFVLVTSRQHMARALRAFRSAGFDPVPVQPGVLRPARRHAVEDYSIRLGPRGEHCDVVRPSCDGCTTASEDGRNSRLSTSDRRLGFPVRQRNREHRAACSAVFSVDAAAVQLDQVTHDR